MARKSGSRQVGSGFGWLAGLDLGQLSNVAFTRDVMKLEHYTNALLEFKRDLIIPIQTQIGASFNIERLSGPNVNAMFGYPGFRTPSMDDRVAGGIITPGTFTSLPKVDTKRVQMYNTPEGNIPWMRLPYAMYSSDALAPKPVVSVSGRNVEGGTPNAYVGFWVTALAATSSTHESIISNVAIVPHNSATAGDGDEIELKVRLHSSHTTTNRLKVYRAVFTYNSTSKTYVGTPATDMCMDLDGSDHVEHTISALGVQTITTYAKRAAVASSGHPPLPVLKVCDPSAPATTYDWLTDYDLLPNHKGGSAIRRTPTGDIDAYQIVEVQYYWNAASAVDIPLGTSHGQNPVVPLELQIPFPSGESAFMINLWRVQVNQSFVLALNERDFTNIPFQGDALDAEDEHPDSPYGTIRIVGTAAEDILAGNNYVPILNNGELADYESSAQ